MRILTGADELAGASTWLITQLLYNTNTALADDLAELIAVISDANGDYRLFENIAPIGSAYPMGMIQFVAGSDVSTQDQTRLMSVVQYYVKMVDIGDSFVAASHAYRIMDYLIRGRNGYVTVDNQQYWISGCTRKMPIQYSQEIESQRYNHVGGKYELHIQAWPPP